MSVGFELVNASKKEMISFAHLPVNTKSEIIRNPVSASIIAWYLSEYQGDEIQFVSDTYDDWPFSIGMKSDLSKYTDVTDETLATLIHLGILKDVGFEFQDPDEPNLVFIRAIRHCGVIET
jgi:hypothetical protein